MKYKIKYKTLILELGESQGIVNTPQKIVDIMHSDNDFDPSSEQMWLIGMDIKNDVHLKHLVAKGTYNSVVVLPSDIFSHLLRLNLRNFILVHNHPSGDKEPSEDDINFTKKIKSGSLLVGLNLLDHLIITSEESVFYSFKKEGLLD